MPRTISSAVSSLSPGWASSPRRSPEPPLPLLSSLDVPTPAFSPSHAVQRLFCSQVCSSFLLPLQLPRPLCSKNLPGFSEEPKAHELNLGVSLCDHDVAATHATAQDSSLAQHPMDNSRSPARRRTRSPYFCERKDTVCGC